jgi:phospholipase A-2-activating protein
MSFILKKEVKVSTKSLRCADLRNDHIALGSLSKKVFLYKSSNGQYELLGTFGNFDSEVYSLKFVSDELIAVGCRNGKIFLIDLQGKIVQTIGEGTSTVSSIDVWGNFLAVGCWDATCAIWDLQTFQTVKVLDDHKYAVVAKFLPNGDLLTGSQSGVLNLWRSQTFEKIHSVHAHDNIIRDIQISENCIFTCSNDSFVKTWGLSLETLGQAKLHSSFVFSASPVITDEGWFVISAGEDFKMIMSKDMTEVDCVYLPTAIWKIIPRVEEKEALVIGSDGFLRIFGISGKGELSAELHNKLILESLNIMLSNPEIPDEDLSRFESKNKLSTTNGKWEGEVRAFKSEGKVEIYEWRIDQWQPIGEVQNKKQELEKKFFEGDDHFPQGDYDFIFDVEHESGNMWLMPFNKGQDPAEVANKFILRQKLKEEVREQIIQFICVHAQVPVPEVKPSQTEISEEVHIYEEKSEDQSIKNNN